MMEILPRISVVICTYNRAQMLMDCVQSFIQQDLAEDHYELVISDDGSTDQTREMVQRLIRSDDNSIIRYIFRSHGGVNATRNAGIAASRGDIIVFADDDTLAPEDYLRRIQDVFENNSETHGLGGPLKDTGQSMLRTCNRCSLAGAAFPIKEQRKVSELIGGNMAIRAELFQTIGLFDEEISGRGDETEWFRRAKGHTFIYDPDLWVWHRRDNFSLWGICRLSFRQGLAIPIYNRKTDSLYRVSPAKIARLIAHAIVHRCSRGLVLAFREFGAIWGHFGIHRTAG